MVKFALVKPGEIWYTNWEIICIVLFEELEKFLMQLAELLENEYHLKNGPPMEQIPSDRPFVLLLNSYF